MPIGGGEAPFGALTIGRYVAPGIGVPNGTGGGANAPICGALKLCDGCAPPKGGALNKGGAESGLTLGPCAPRSADIGASVPAAPCAGGIVRGTLPSRAPPRRAAALAALK